MDYDPESPEARAAMSQPVGVATICPSPTNPRKSFDPDKHTEMVDSVRKLGVLQPIVVRPWPADYPWTGDMPLQDDALEKVTAHNMNHRSAADFIRERYMLDLREAPFPFDTLETLHGHCQDCPKRTGNQPELYRDVRSADICTDPTCYGEKRTFNLVRMTADAQRAGRRVATPEEAKKIMPYGDTRHAYGGYAPMDAQWYGQVVDGKYKTPRELITTPYGMDHPDVLLVPNPATGRLVEVIKEGALRTAIKERMPAEQAEASTPSPDTSAHTERQKAAKSEAAYRMALFEAIDGEILLKGVPLPEDNRRLIAWQFWARLGYDAQARLARHWLPDGIFDNDAQRAAVVDVEKMDSNALNRFIFLCALVGMLDVPHYTNNIETPSQLTDCARRFGDFDDDIPF